MVPEAQEKEEDWGEPGHIHDAFNKYENNNNTNTNHNNDS